MKIICTAEECDKIMDTFLYSESVCCLFEDCSKYKGDCKECLTNNVEWEITNREKEKVSFLNRDVVLAILERKSDIHEIILNVRQMPTVEIEGRKYKNESC